MWQRIGLGAAVLIMIGAGAEAQRRSSADEAAIRQARKDHVAAYNRHDAKALAMQFASDGDRVAGTGEMFSGRARVEQGYADSFTSVDRHSVVTDLTEMRIRFLTADIALTDITDQ